MRTAIVSTFPPRPCGIGTFAADLRATLTGTDAVTVAALDTGLVQSMRVRPPDMLEVFRSLTDVPDG